MKKKKSWLLKGKNKNITKIDKYAKFLNVCIFAKHEITLGGLTL